MDKSQNILVRDFFGRPITDRTLAKIFATCAALEALHGNLKETKRLIEIVGQSIPCESILSTFESLVASLPAHTPYAMCPLYDPDRYPPPKFPDIHTKDCRCCHGKRWLSKSEYENLTVKDWRRMAEEWAQMEPEEFGNRKPLPNLTLKPRHVEILQAALAIGATSSERRRKAALIVNRIASDAKIGTFKAYFSRLVKWQLLAVNGHKNDAGYWLTDEGRRAVDQIA